MQKTIALLKKNDELRVIDEELDIYLEIPHLAYAEVKKKDGGKALLFTNVVDKKNNKKFNEPVLMNLFGSYKRTELLFGRTIESVADEITNLLHMKPVSGFMNKITKAKELFSLKNIFPKRLKEEGACQEVKFLENDIDLSISTPIGLLMLISNVRHQSKALSSEGFIEKGKSVGIPSSLNCL